MVAKRRTSLRSVAELSFVLRSLLASFETAGVRRTAGHRAALDLADSFARGASTTAEALKNVRAEVAAERARYATTNAPLYIAFCRLPIDALLLMVERGDDEAAHVITYASYCVLGADSAAAVKRIDALRAEAAPHVAAISDAPLPVRAKHANVRAQSKEAALLEVSRAALSREAHAIMERLGPARDASQTTDGAALAKLLTQLDFPVSDAVLAFEATFGGLLLPTTRMNDWREDRRYTRVGAWAAFHPRSRHNARGGKTSAATRLVPVALGRQDDVYFLDEHGAAWYHDTIGEPGAISYGANGAELVTRLMLSALTFASEDRDGTPVFPAPERIASAAPALGLTRLYADETSEWWSGDCAVLVVFKGQTWGQAWTPAAVTALGPHDSPQ